MTQEVDKVIGKLTTKWQDAEFKRQLLADPEKIIKDAFQSEHIEIDEATKAKLAEVVWMVRSNPNIQLEEIRSKYSGGPRI